jgi:hypothetical protein
MPKLRNMAMTMLIGNLNLVLGLGWLLYFSFPKRVEEVFR